MKTILMFMIESCPHCQNAFRWMEELKNENPAYGDIPLKVVDENIEADLARQYDYYYVPTYFVDDIKVHEGVPTKELVRNVFETALKDI
ncbi:MAG: thioredoxin family protein [Dehalobacterium sp.]|jgi:thioredoxin 1